MPIHRTILSDGTLGYKWGTTGKPYKRLQDARNQEKAVYASGWREKKDQSVKDVCPECGKEKCECKKEKKDSKKANFYGPELSPEDAQYVQQMKKLTGAGALPRSRQLSYTSVVPLISSTLAGAGIGAGIGAYKSDEGNKGGGAITGGILGGAAGLLLAAICNGIGSSVGSFEHVPRRELKDKLENLGLEYYLVPGMGAQLQAQVANTFNEAQSAEPPKGKRR